MSIILDHKAQFTLGFWESLQEAMGTSLKMSTTFHPQIDRQTKHTNQVMEAMLKAYTIDFKSSWEMHLPFVKFAYNNSYHSSIRMAPFKA